MGSGRSPDSGKTYIHDDPRDDDSVLPSRFQGTTAYSRINDPDESRPNISAVPADQFEQILSMNMSETGLDLRAMNALEEKGVYTVRDVISLHAHDVVHIPGLGVKSIENIIACIANIGLPTAAMRRNLYAALVSNGKMKKSDLPIDLQDQE